MTTKKTRLIFGALSLGFIALVVMLGALEYREWSSTRVLKMCSPSTRVIEQNDVYKMQVYTISTIGETTYHTWDTTYTTRNQLEALQACKD